MTVKRSWRGDEDWDIEKLAMANCLMLLSGVGTKPEPGRVFHCKTCNKAFGSFQALGGHRASHKRPKLVESRSPAKPKTHGCGICGMEFELGQALGGHMRRHRDKIGQPESDKKAGLGLDLNLTPQENELNLKMFRSSEMVAVN